MINEETLTFYYYEDGLSTSERLTVTTALNQDAELAARYARLSRQLQQWRESDTHQTPPHLAQRWHDSIDEAAGVESATSTNMVGKPPLHFLSFAWGAVAMATLALGIGIGVYFSENSADVEMINTSELLVTRTDVQATTSFERGFKLHLRDSQRQLVGLTNEASTDRILLLMQIIDQNRLFERAAMRNDAPELARVLRAFEPVLTQLAAVNLSPGDAEVLHKQLAFELNVLLAKMTRDASDEARSVSI